MMLNLTQYFIWLNSFVFIFLQLLIFVFVLVMLQEIDLFYELGGGGGGGGRGGWVNGKGGTIFGNEFMLEANTKGNKNTNIIMFQVCIWKLVKMQ